MQTLAIVEQLDILEQILPDLVHACVASTIDQLLFQAGEEALHRRVVIRVARRGAVAVLDSLAQALRVVVDVADKVRGGT